MAVMSKDEQQKKKFDTLLTPEGSIAPQFNLFAYSCNPVAEMWENDSSFLSSSVPSKGNH